MRHHFLIALGISSLISAAFAITPTVLRCENRIDPHGIDVANPRLSWILDAGKQSAYQIVVDGVWDSGKVTSDQSVAVEYAGPALESQTRYDWRVRVWDTDDNVGEWSPDGRFVTGVLGQPWQGKWIAGEYGATASKGIGYHAGETTVDEIKWVQVDLGTSMPVEAVVLDSLRHQELDGFGYPLRYRIEGSDDPGFATSVMIADLTAADAPNPGNNAVTHPANATIRYVRVTATKLYPWNSNFIFALSEMRVISGGSNAALGAPVSFKDTVDNYGWHHEALTAGYGSAPQRLPVFKRGLAIEKQVEEAVLSISGLGHYELFLNGNKVGDDLLAPGWSNYRKTCLYDTFDLTQQLTQGNHEFRVMLGNGFFNIPGGRYVKLQTSFGQPMLTMQMRIRFTDGTEQTLISDESWQTANSPITFSCVYGGEDYDARIEALLEDSSAWSPVNVIDGPGGALTGLSQAADPIGAIETLQPVSVNTISPNLIVYDLGQNVSFMPRLTVTGVAGASVKMIPAELLAGDGRINDPMCGGNSYYTYTLKGAEGGETWFPQFFYRGGRYLQVELSAPDGMALPEIQSLESVVVHSKARPTGDFECSNELFNRIRNLIRWAQRSNLMSVISDCPHREKLGWLEQYHLHGYALRHEWDMASIYVKGMADMAQAQLENGLVPDIAPEYTIFGGGFRDSPEWGSSFVIVPWQQYEYTGDTSLLETYFEGMKRYCDYLESRSLDLIVSHGLGDWYDIGPNPPGISQLTPLEVTATAYFFRCADIISRAATLLGKTEDAARYGTLASQIRAAFNARFWNEDAGIFSTGSQCANAVPHVMGIAEPHMRDRALDAIVRDVQEKGLTAGDVGFHYLLRALYEGGRSDVIYTMNNQSDRPGYGYQLAQGATALTEAWNAETRSSHNHFMLGHITEWLYAGLGGIKPDPSAPGWKKFIIKPAVVGDLTWVRTHYDSPYGRIVSNWRKENGRFILDATIPANSTATVVLPDGSSHQVDPGAHQWTIDLPIPPRTSQILLEDDFDSPNYRAEAFNDTLDVDQSGALAPSPYTITTAGEDWQAQHGNGGELILVGDAGYAATAALNQDFALPANEFDLPLSIQVDVRLAD
ncbi:MAG: family 78 glycoside hydrolase catalytic domain, partial [Verrucomicrobiae bacterium]|nr:family 78 glycoside hydrolase catalytic domain [Verrucomicrobiae bacterium]